jgi:hypothetical protein
MERLQSKVASVVTPQFRYQPNPRLRRPVPENKRASASRLRDHMARPKHRATQAGTYFISAATWQRRSLFHIHDWAATVEERIVHYRDQGAYRLHRYAVMPDHIHVLLTPGEVLSLGCRSERRSRFRTAGGKAAV